MEGVPHTLHTPSSSVDAAIQEPFLKRFNRVYAHSKINRRPKTIHLQDGCVVDFRRCGFHCPVDTTGLHQHFMLNIYQDSQCFLTYRACTTACADGTNGVVLGTWWYYHVWGNSVSHNKYTSIVFSRYIGIVESHSRAVHYICNEGDDYG